MQPSSHVIDCHKHHLIAKRAHTMYERETKLPLQTVLGQSQAGLDTIAQYLILI